MWWRTINNRQRSLWQELDRMRNELDRLARTESRVAAPPTFPALNVWSSAEGLIVTAEIPGVTAEDIDISIVGETMTLSGSRDPEFDGDEVRYHRRERGCGQFNRTLELPYRIETDQVEATFDKGVLTVTLPRAEEDKPKKIAVQVAS